MKKAAELGEEQAMSVVLGGDADTWGEWHDDTKWKDWHDILDEMDIRSQEERKDQLEQWQWEQRGGKITPKKKRGRPKKQPAPPKRNRKITDSGGK